MPFRKHSFFSGRSCFCNERINKHFPFLLAFFLSITHLVTEAQVPSTTKIELLNADVSEFDEKKNANATRLIGNVRFKHESALMFCDSAYLIRNENRLEAYGFIRVRQGDSLQLTGGRLDYDGYSRLAKVYDDVVLSDRKMTLTTSRIDYNLGNATAYYTDSAHIVDGENILTSRTGFYFSKTRDLFFREDVRLVNPKYTLDADTLRYNTSSKISYFLGPTNIRTADSRMYTDNGWYNTEKQTCSFNGNSYLETKEQVLRGDSIFYNQRTSIGKAFGNVSLYDSTRKVIIRGNYAEHHDAADSSWVTDHAEMVQIFASDSLFLHADTLLAYGTSVSDSTTAAGGIGRRDVIAFHHVKMFRSNMQGVCDSLSYTYKDSTIRFIRDPILWSGLNQMTADSISLLTGGGEVRAMVLKHNAFIVSKADSLQEGPLDSIRFNQVRGKEVFGTFNNSKMERIDVKGNGQTIYYAAKKEGGDFAVNRADCSDLIIRVDDNKLKSITLVKEPEGTLYPIKELTTSELRLKGFRWEEKSRPTSREDLFK